jgi:hypothetical protein
MTDDHYTPPLPPLSEAAFLSLSDDEVRTIMAPHRLGISLLLNGTRRLFLATRFATPPRDLEYLPACLDFIHRSMAELVGLLVRHGIHRVFLPAYSADQRDRDPRAHRYLVEGLRLLTSHPALVRAYQAQGIAVRFYGAVDELPVPAREHIAPADFGEPGRPRAFVHYGIDGGDPYRHVLRLAHELGAEHGRAPTREELVERYYGEPDVRRLDILVAFNRTYARLGIPPCLDGQDRIYTTAVSPLVLTASMLRRILYDHLFRDQDRGRDYLDLDERQHRRIKTFYAHNREAIMGLTIERDGLCFPSPAIHWPRELLDEVSPGACIDDTAAHCSVW